MFVWKKQQLQYLKDVQVSHRVRHIFQELLVVVLIRIIIVLELVVICMYHVVLRVVEGEEVEEVVV